MRGKDKTREIGIMGSNQDKTGQCYKIVNKVHNQVFQRDVDKMQTRTRGLADSRTRGLAHSKISLLSLQAFREMVVCF